MEVEIINGNCNSMQQEQKNNECESSQSNNQQPPNELNEVDHTHDSQNQSPIQKQVKKRKKTSKKGKKKKKLPTSYYPQAQAPNALLAITDQMIKLDKAYILREAYAHEIIDKSLTFQKYLKRQNKEKVMEEESEQQQQQQQEQIQENEKQNNEEECQKVNEVKLKLDAEDKSIKITKIQNIDILRKKTSDDNYVIFDDWKKDLMKLITFTKKYRCESEKSIQYLDELLIVIETKIPRWEKSYTEIKRNDLSQLFKKDLDWKISCSNWPQIPKQYRQYEEINEYFIPENQNKEQIEDILQTNLSPKDCPDDCQCTGLVQDLGEFNYETGGWNSQCLNKKQRIECSSGSQYHLQNCKNREITQQQRKILQADVEECWCWGIDLYTRKNVYYCFPDIAKLEDRYLWIQEKLMKALSLMGIQGYDMKEACKFIIKEVDENLETNCQKRFNKYDKKIAKRIIQIIDMNVEPEAFRVYPKGKGLICINQNGIKQNEFIIEYIGEIYLPYRWFEKQDVIKKFMKDHSKKNDLLDFYNIMLETHKDDPKGYYLLFIDPIAKGNYSSRLSHSCSPNCGTIVTIANGKYNVALYALKNILPGEELTFDYCSVTEELQEFKRAFCLCGSSRCRGKYLELTKSKDSNEFIENTHNFLDRNACLLKACTRKLQSIDIQKLEK